MQRPYREPPRCGGLDVLRAGPRLRNSERACAVVAMLCVCARPERQSFAFVGGNGLVGSCGRDTSARPGAATHFARPWAAASGPRAQTLLGKDGFTVWRAALEVSFQNKTGTQISYIPIPPSSKDLCRAARNEQLQRGGFRSAITGFGRMRRRIAS